MNKEALSFNPRSPEWRSNQSSPNFNPPQPESICAPLDLVAANEVEGFHAFNRVRARLLFRRTAVAIKGRAA